MKIVYVPKDKSKLLNQFEETANHYQTEVKKHDEGEGHFIFVRSRIMITELQRENEIQIHVTGANEEDLIFLNQIWGEPEIVSKEKRSPMEFAKDIIEIPNIDKFDKADIINILDITEKDYNQYTRYLERVTKRRNSPEMIIKAVQLLKEKS